MKAATKFLISGAFTAVLFSCNSVVHDKLSTGSVVRDCTGTYVRLGENEDYLVCNSDILQEKSEGDKVTITYNDTKTCPENEYKIVCMMYHENKGIIRIKSIK